MVAHNCRNFILNCDFLQFLGCLNVNSSPIRYAVRKVMKVAKLSNLDFFEASVHGLIKNLETYPQVCFGIVFFCFLSNLSLLCVFVH